MSFFSEFWTTVAAILVKFRVVLKVGFFVGALISAFQEWFFPLWELLFETMDSLVFPDSDVSGNFQLLSTVNYIFPFDTLLTFLGQFLIFKGTLTVVRVIKSWIPTVN